MFAYQKWTLGITSYFPVASAHTNHSPTSLADVHPHKPVLEMMEKVESLISHSHLNQISRKLAVQDWIYCNLIPENLQQGILSQTLRV